MQRKGCAFCGSATSLEGRYTGKPVSGWGGLVAVMRYLEKRGVRQVLAQALPWSWPAFVDGVGEKGRRRPPMPRTHPPYAPEYRRRIIELTRAGRPIAQLAREFEASANAIRKWVKQAGLDEGLRSDGLTTAEREELNRLRRENRVLREEREILSKAAAWFATETGSVPSRRSNS